MAVLETDGTVGHADFILMDEVSEEDFMTNLRLRYQANKIYTYIGETVVSVNPYHMVDIYNDAVVEDYKGRELYERPPHIFALADAAFQNMKWHGRDTCIVISGNAFDCVHAHMYVHTYVCLFTAWAVMLGQVCLLDIHVHTHAHTCTHKATSTHTHACMHMYNRLSTITELDYWTFSKI